MSNWESMMESGEEVSIDLTKDKCDCLFKKCCKKYKKPGKKRCKGCPKD